MINNNVLNKQGTENVNAELSDTSEPLIHNTYGYGSQGLINFMLTGQAVAHVWDNDQDVGGLSKYTTYNYHNQNSSINKLWQLQNYVVLISNLILDLLL